MKRLLLFAMLVSIFGVANVDAQTTQGGVLTKEEREKAISYLKQTRDKFLDSVKGLSEEQWKFKPAADRWSVAEVAEHIGLSEQTIFGMITDRVMKSPADPSKREAVKGIEDKIIVMIPDRSQRAQAPEVLRPVGKWATRDALVEEFKKSRGTAISFIKDSNEPMRDHFGPNPVFKEIDAYQWVFFMAAHTARHTLQIEEVKADPNFPKKKGGY